MIKSILIEDDPEIRKDLREKITRLFGEEITIVAEADDVETALSHIEEHQPDLLFLDIHLKEGTGFDVLTNTPYKDFDVIFITGFDNHAIKAIKVGALDYIIKPVDELELKEAIEKAIKNKQEDKHLEKLAQVSSEYFKGTEKKRIVIKTSNTVYAIYEDDILYCKSDGNYTTLFTQHFEKIVASKPIKKILEVLSEDVFVRCHQSYIVNKKYVSKYNKNGVLVLIQDIKVPVSSRRQDYVLKRIF
ncbi:LytR/AlgR family response regulator transcription factor [Pseudotenacibaculum haliotis]|uniref:LytR/AlgR family response regulator transcription factor n=1 Tax=Pseudotenacibaculum haliotis TaxID=1862138 RepID=A0ABW5LLZ3_9FLAO